MSTPLKGNQDEPFRNLFLNGDERPGFCRPEWGCRYCWAGDCEWDKRHPKGES